MHTFVNRAIKVDVAQNVDFLQNIHKLSNRKIIFKDYAESQNFARRGAGGLYASTAGGAPRVAAGYPSPSSRGVHHASPTSPPLSSHYPTQR